MTAAQMEFTVCGKCGATYTRERTGKAGRPKGLPCPSSRPARPAAGVWLQLRRSVDARAAHLRDRYAAATSDGARKHDLREARALGRARAWLDAVNP